jgi:hypothetical protein
MTNIFKNSKIIILFLFVMMLVFIPVFSNAQSSKPLVPCGVETHPANTEDANGIDISYQVINPCGFDHIFELINNIVNFLLFTLALPLAAILFAYAGFLFMFSGMQPEQRTKAKKIFGNVAFGFILAVAAWVIVHTILTILGYNGAWIGL